MELQKHHRCPKCGYDYEPWIEICPDCGVLVEDSVSSPPMHVVKGSLDPNEDPRWTVVTNVPNAIIGNLIKSQLEDAGIPVLMQRAPSADIAQFSGNDYVPQDLRVPFHMLADARRLLDSAPDRSAGAPYWGSDLDEYATDSEAGENLRPPLGSPGGPSGNPDDGWTMLPDRQRPESSQTQGWHWATRGDSAHAPQPPERTNQARDDRRAVDDEPLDVDKIRFSQPYEREYYDETSGEPSKWIRVVYGILLLAISLPFLFQLLQQIASFLNFR